MSELDVIIPVHNEVETVCELAERLDKSLSAANIKYSAIFVDDYSTDGTREKIAQLISGNGEVTKTRSLDLGNVIYEASTARSKRAAGSQIRLVLKKGRKGKAYSVLEGARVSKAPYVAMIDGDLQYPPEAIPSMYELARNQGMVVANRKNYENSWIRGEGSKINKFLFERLLLGFKCDTQSGLKVFKREIIDNLGEDEVGPWTLDMPLLAKGLELGYEIGTVDIDFSQRKSGQSKVNFVKTAIEIATSAVRLKFKKKKTYPIASRKKRPLGAGIVHEGRRFTTHTSLSKENSALITIEPWQRNAILLVLFATLAGLAIQPMFTGIFVAAILSLVYFLDLLFSVYVLFKNLDKPCELTVSEKELEDLNEASLPVYSILCPLYKEANVLPEFIKSIDKLDWPKDKLDVILLLEENDEETIRVLDKIDLPKHFRKLVVPQASPKTKPKACNFGLAHAKGEYVVIYDAEDKPEPLQLKKAYVAFGRVGPKVVCLQSKLNYYNVHDNLITRLFTAEYSLWFDLILPGLQSIDTTIPLGGTSNHFRAYALRYLDAWDPFNVTEDCDLGTRLFKAGLKTAIIDSTTYEEANARLGSWLKQRSRWIKGYLQTYLVHMRDPVEFVKRNGIHALIFQLVVGARMTFLVINPILWMVTISYFAAYSLAGAAIEALYPAPIFYIAATSMIFGNFLYLYVYMIGCAEREQWDLIKYVFFVPLYWFAASAAAVRAFYQLISAPYYWEKTEHGVSLGQKQVKLPQYATMPQFVTTLKAKLNLPVRISISFEKFDSEFMSRLLGPAFRPIFFIVRVLFEVVDLFLGVPNPGGVDNDKLRVLIFNWRDTKHVWAGGAEVYIHELAKGWVKEGHKVTLFSGWDGDSKRNEEVDGVSVIRRGGFYTVYPLAMLYYLFKFRGRYDVVVDCENGIPFFTPIFVNVPSVLLIHHVHQEVFREHLRFPLSGIALLLESRLMPYLYKNHPIVTISESSKKDIIERGWSQGKSVDIVTPGIEKGKFRRSEKTAWPSFVYLGRLKHYKNIDSAIYAFAKVRKKHPEVIFTIAGFGEAIEHLKVLAKKLALGESVVFSGKVDDDTRRKLLSESWAAIQPSSIEGWGITVIEANACGTPVIASDVKGLRDSVLNGKTGILFPVGNVDALSAQMETLISNSNLRESLSREAYAWSRQFDWGKSVKGFEQILTKHIRMIDLLGTAYKVSLEFKNYEIR